MYADFMIWPWIERLEFLEKYRGYNFDTSRLANFASYMDRMRNVPACRQLAISAEKFEKFFQAIINKEQPDYDIGIEE